MLFVEELKAYENSSKSVIHVFKIRSDASTGFKNTQKIMLDDIKIYPNPVKNLFYIESKIREIAYIYNTEGKKLKTIRLKIGINEIYISDLPKGVYIMKVKEQNIKFVKQ